MVVTARGMLLPVVAFALLLPIQVQAQTAVCSNTPGTGERIECSEDATSTTDIDIDVDGVDIDTTTEPGIYAEHLGNADIEIDVLNSSTIDTTGDPNRGVDASHSGTGNTTINISDSTIKTQGTNATAVRSWSFRNGHGTVRVTGSIIEASGDRSAGIRNEKPSRTDIPSKSVSGDSSTYITDSNITVTDGSFAVFGGVGENNADGDVLVDVRDGTSITTAEMSGTGGAGTGISAQNLAGVGNVHVNMYDSTSNTLRHGIDAQRHAGGRGSVYVDVRDSMLHTQSRAGFGVYARNYSENSTVDDILDVTVRNSNITTDGAFGVGVYAWHQGEGDLTVKVLDGSTIVTKSTEFFSETNQNTISMGIFANNVSVTGNTTVIFENSRITTAGTDSRGLYARKRHADGTGNINVELRNGYITTEGESAEGVYVANDNGMGQLYVSVEGGEIRANGGNAHGIQVAEFDDEGEIQRASAVGEDGYRTQTIRVNGLVRGGTGNGAGIFLVGGGKVFIGPQGTVGAASGISIHASGGNPKLYVDMDLDGRRVREVIGDDYILNDGGETTLVVNGVVLHDGAMGSTGHRAPNGVWDVRMREEGVTVTERMGETPEDWTITEPVVGVIVDRDFSAQDFTESEARCPQGQIGFPDCMVPPEESEMSMFVEEYAPRSAVYEALSGAVHRLDARGLPEDGFARTGSPLWVRFTGGSGSFEADHATVGADYDFNRFSAEAGLNVPIGENLMGSISVRGIRGDVDVGALTGGGEIDADGVGVAFGVSYSGAGAYYAHGRFSLTHYDLDLSSDTRGSLKKGLDVRSHILDFEAGRRVTTVGGVGLIPRLWMKHSKIDVDDFTDMVDSRVFVDDETRFIGGLGLVAEGQQTVKNGELLLRGSVGLERTFSGSTTSVDVSGTRLLSEAPRTRLLLALGGTYRRGAFWARAGISAGGPGSDDEFYAGHIRLGWEY